MPDARPGAPGCGRATRWRRACPAREARAACGAGVGPASALGGERRGDGQPARVVVGEGRVAGVRRDAGSRRRSRPARRSRRSSSTPSNRSASITTSASPLPPSSSRERLEVVVSQAEAPRRRVVGRAVRDEGGLVGQRMEVRTRGPRTSSGRGRAGCTGRGAARSRASRRRGGRMEARCTPRGRATRAGPSSRRPPRLSAPRSPRRARSRPRRASVSRRPSPVRQRRSGSRSATRASSASPVQEERVGTDVMASISAARVPPVWSEMDRAAGPDGGVGEFRKRTASCSQRQPRARAAGLAPARFGSLHTPLFPCDSLSSSARRSCYRPAP